MATPKINTAFTWRQAFYLGGTLVASPTLAAGDAVVYTAGGSTGNLNTLTSVAYGADCTASATQMNGADVFVVFIDQTSPKAWDPFTVFIPLDTHNLDDLAFPIRSGTAQAGAGTSITLDAAANATNSFYNNAIVLITGGTGAGQARFISAYVGSTKVATVATWVTNPDSTSTFLILPFDAVAGASAPTAAQVATAVWTDLLAGSDFSTAASIGKLLKDDIDAAVSSRMATYTQPSGFLAATFPTGTVANTTNITAASVTVSDKTGFSLSTAGILAIWHQLTAAVVTAGTMGKLLLDNIDAAISSRLSTAGYTAPLTAASTRTALGLASPNLDTQLDALPTNAELATALGTADDAVLAAIAALNNLSSVGAQTAAAAALLAYSTAKTSDVPSAATVAAAVQTSASATPLPANIKKINDVTMTGTGVVGDEFEP